MKLLILLLLAGCASTKYNSPSLYLFHKGDKVKIDECVSFDYFERVCESTGKISSFSDSKSKCYPELSYTVEFWSAMSGHYTIGGFCASDLLLMKAE